MPGLNDAHWHAIMTATTLENLLDGEACYAFIKAGGGVSSIFDPLDSPTRAGSSAEQKQKKYHLKLAGVLIY